MSALAAVALLCSLDFSGVDLVQKGKVRWSKLDAGEHITVQVAAGLAARMNPNWSPKPEKLAYDLGRNRTLERALKHAPLASHASVGESDDTRTLEVDVQDARGEWKPAGKWTLPLKTWRKGKLAALTELLEPLLSVKPELFENLPSKEPEPQ